MPDDVSVTGLDDVPEATCSTPPPTTLRLDVAAQGRLAVLELLRRLDPDRLARPITLTAELVVRASTGPARTGPAPKATGAPPVAA